MNASYRFSPGTSSWRRLRLVALALLAGAAPVAPMRAQSLDGGAVSGVVRDATGRILPAATVTLVERITGGSRVRSTPRDGSYSFTLLRPSDYDLLVERFGYQPRLLRSVPVRAGSFIRLDVVLAAGTTAGVDTSAYPGAPPGGAHYALDGGRADDHLAALADRAGLMTGVASLLPGVGEDLTAEGLPGRLGALALDGLVHWSTHHSRLSSGALDGMAFPLPAVHGIELLPGGIDAEWQAAGGGLLSGFTVPGTRTVGARLGLSGGPDGQSGAFVVAGPAVRDTAHFAFGVAATRLNPRIPAPWPSDSLGNGAVATAQDSFQVDLSPYQRTYKPVTTIVSGFGRFDWLITGDHRLTVRADGATATLNDPVLAPAVPATLGASVKARDLSIAALLTSTIGSRVGSEFKVAYGGSSRDYSAASVVGTMFTEGGFAAGTADIQPGLFKRSSMRISETVHYRLRVAALKAGMQFGFNSFDQTFTEGRSGVFTFGDSVDFAARRGAFWQTVGPSPVASFKTSTIGGFLQGLFRPTATLEVLVGVHYEQETVPSDQLRLNTEWRRLTGIDNRVVPHRRVLASPRLSFTWTPDAQRRWQVIGEAARFVEPTDAGELAEALTHDAGVQVRRGFGVLGRWPLVPDSTAAPVQGKSLTILGPQYVPPQTSRARLGITVNVHGTIVRFQTAYRHTDYLPLRRDLNLPPTSTAQDQDGRVIYGTLTKAGSLVGPVPGSNRRFAAFDDVSTLDPAAASDYYGLSAGIERVVTRGISLMATYTFSRTTDNWFGARDGNRDAQFVPFPDTSTWAKGRSDFDVPHRIVLGTEIRIPGRLGARVVAMYRRRSGYPFTPGFRDGVDVNGDGSGRNDPAFVIDTLPGADVVVRGSACVRSQVGRFAERNSCREPSVGMLDLRLALQLGGPAHARTELTFDVLGLAATGLDVTDHALYLVDPAAPLVTTPAGVTRIPLIANPNFGRTLAKRSPGVGLRAGVRVAF